jgi:serine/threonine-protein kinase RsbW
MATAMGGLELTVPASTHSAGDARRILQPLRSTYPDAAVDDLALLITELVTNEVRHGAGRTGCPIVIRIFPVIAGLRVEVMNPSPAEDVRIARRPGGPDGGFGLKIVDEVAASWGVARNGGLTVWAEVTV